MVAKKSMRRVKKVTAEEVVEPTSTPKKFPVKYLYFIVALLALSALLLANKGMFLAAVVDGKPIFRWELTNVLTDRYGAQTLEGMVSELLIEKNAREKGVVVSSGEVATREDAIVQDLGEGVSLEEILNIQGISREEFDRQIRMRLMVEKLLSEGIAVTEEDIDNYIATNRAILVATDEAALRAEARQAILDAHVGEKLQGWFNELKEKAKILRFL